MARLTVPIALVLAAAPPRAHATGEPGAEVAAPSADSRVRLLDLPSIRRLYRALAGETTSSWDARAAAWTEFSTMAGAVLGVDPEAVPLETLTRAGADPRGPLVPVAPGVDGRDEAAYRLLALGYSARETADVVSGRISERALDMARRMIAVGRGPVAAADYLDSKYRLEAAAERRARRPGWRRCRARRAPSMRSSCATPRRIAWSPR